MVELTSSQSKDCHMETSRVVTSHDSSHYFQNWKWLELIWNDSRSFSLLKYNSDLKMTRTRVTKIAESGWLDSLNEWLVYYSGNLTFVSSIPWMPRPSPPRWLCCRRPWRTSSNRPHRLSLYCRARICPWGLLRNQSQSRLCGGG